MNDIGMLRLPRTIEWGIGARRSLPRLIRECGQRVFIVVDPFLATTPMFLEIVDALHASKTAVAIHTEVLPELPVESLVAAADEARQFSPDVIVGYGGGSALDAAKLIGVLLTHGGSLAGYYGENAVPGPILPLIAVPTTAGTGSEVTPVAVVADAGRELKVGISSPHLVPLIAVVDPELSLGAPSTVTAYAGIDALVHAIESFTARSIELDWRTGPFPVFVGRNALTDSLSLEAIRLLGGAIETAVLEPMDIAARERMARGSLLAGMAFGATGTHLSHALQYPIGAQTHTPHGLGTGLMLPYVLAACADAVPGRLAQVGEALGVGADADAAITKIVAINASIGLPGSLRELGVEREQLPRIAELALASKRLVTIAPVPVDASFLLAVLEAAWSGNVAMLTS